MRSLAHPTHAVRPEASSFWPLCVGFLVALLGLPTPAQAQPPTRPSLYVLAVAVSNYADPAMPDLEYPDDDARAMLAWAEAQTGHVYGTVKTKLLLNEQASRTGIIDALVTFYADAAPSDQLVLFLAGHGLVSAQGSYHFLPYEARPDAIEATGLEQDDILAKLQDRRSPRQRVLVLTDTCQSGALGEAMPTGLVAGSFSASQSSTAQSSTAQSSAAGTVLQRSTRGLSAQTDMQLSEGGVPDRSSLWLVFSAGTAADNAGEGAKYRLPTDPAGVEGHGIFTWAILQALASRSADRDLSGTVTLSEFVQSVSSAVRQETSDQQLPVMSGRFMDVPLAWAPGTEERCDGLDNDLDGEIDEGLDRDGDGKISQEESFDQNDNDFADCLEDEICNGRDDNGNGQVDEGFDRDGDGHRSLKACGRELGGDCDDTRIDVHPNQADWGNLRDDDCDGFIDEDDVDLNGDGRPDRLEKRLRLTRGLQLGTAGVGLALLSSGILSTQAIRSLETPPSGTELDAYLLDDTQTVQWQRLVQVQRLTFSTGGVMLGASIGFSFYGNELRRMLPPRLIKAPSIPTQEGTTP